MLRLLLSPIKPQLLKLYLLKRRVDGLLEHRAFLRAVKRSDELKIVVGSSGVYEKGWIPTDQPYLDLLDRAHWQSAFGEKKIKVILAEHVFEHLTKEQTLKALKICHEFLAPKGWIRIAVPDGWHPDPDYIDYVKPGGSGEGSDDHKVLYTIDSLKDVLRQAGFNPAPLEYFDKAGTFHKETWTPEDGMIHRSAEHDERNRDSLAYTSIIIDGVK